MGKSLRTKLSNGLRCLFIEDVTLKRPMTFFNFGSCSGSAADPKNRSGLAHVMEHLVSRKLTEVKEYFPPALREAHERAHVVFPIARTELDYTRFSVYTPNELHTDTFKFWRTWHEAVPLNEAYVKNCVQEVLLEKKGQLETNQFSKLYDALYFNAFQNHPYRWHTVGRLDQVAEISLKDCSDFFMRQYSPENLFLCCITSMKSSEFPLERLAEEAEAHLGKLKRLSDPSATRPQITEPTQSEPRMASVSETPEQGFAIGLKSPPLVELPTGVLRVLNHLLVGGPSTLRRDYRDIYDVVAGAIPLTRDAGLYEIVGIPGSAAKSTKEAALQILSVCKDFDPLNGEPERFEKAKLLAAAEWKKHSADVHVNIEMLTVYEILGKGFEQWTSELSQIETSTPAQVAELASLILQANRSTVTYTT